MIVKVAKLVTQRLRKVVGMAHAWIPTPDGSAWHPVCSRDAVIGGEYLHVLHDGDARAVADRVECPNCRAALGGLPPSAAHGRAR